MIYGLFFLPVASLAAEQCYRVLEAAARYRCGQLGLLKKGGKSNPSPDAPLANLVLALRKEEIVPEGDLATWQAMTLLRNRFSHPMSQAILSRRDMQQPCWRITPSYWR